MWHCWYFEAAGRPLSDRDDASHLHRSDQWPARVANGRLRPGALFAGHEPLDGRAEGPKRVLPGHDSSDAGHPVLLFLVHS